jgi:hypothetical protein
MIRLLVAVFALCALGFSQGEPHPVVAVEEWWGSYEITVEASASDESGSATVRERVSGEFHLNLKTPGGAMPGREPDLADMLDMERMQQMGTWIQAPEGLPPIDVTMSEAHDSPTLRRNASGSGTTLQPGFVRLFIDGGKKLYGLEIPFGIRTEDLSTRQVIEHQITEGDRAVWKTETRTDYGVRSGKSDAPLIVDEPLPDDFSVLAGSVTQPVSIRGHEGAGTMTVRWTLTSKPVAPVELVVAIEGENGTPYAKWRPRAGMSEEQVGAHLTARARLQKKGGGEPEVEASWIEFRLTEVSLNPGVSINWPRDPVTPAPPDLKFDPTATPDLDVEDDRATREGELLTATAVITSHDFGASAKLQVFATLEDGREITGHLEGDPGMEVIRLPKRRGDSRIADAWRSYHSADGPDREDAEDDPDGDGVKGDGLTLFEEYRGFYEDELWSDGNPAKKDFFICDTYHGLVPAAIDHFRKLTGLEVHDRLERTELSAQRVINANSLDSDRRTLQHGIIVKGSPTATGARAHGGPGSPKKIQFVEVPTSFDPTRLRLVHDPNYVPPSASYFIMAVVHELLHACNVWHHGEADTTEWWLIEEAADGSLQRYWAREDGGKLGNTPFQVYEESGAARPPKEPGLYRVKIAEKNGQHSGVEDCVMRYDNTPIYRKSDSDYYSAPEKAGTGLCEESRGTGSNEELHVPMSRHGDAAPSRGDCRHQIMVNDGVTATDRTLK